MLKALLRMRFLFLVAFVLAATLPVLVVGDRDVQSAVDHAQMMAMAGHPAQMPSAQTMGGPVLDMLCQQHCLFGVSGLPTAERAVSSIACATDVKASIVPLAASLAIPPPAPPPKPVAI